MRKEEKSQRTGVPVEKRLEQQERYVLQQKIVLDFDKKSTLSQVVKKYKKTENQILEILSIIEDDADFIRLAKIKQKEREEYELLRERLVMYNGITRNDKCACGSRLKFKKCCLPRLEYYNLI